MSTLIIISDPVWDDGIYSEYVYSMNVNNQEFIYIDGNTFNNELLEPIYYREKWLEMCHDLSNQAKCTVVFNITSDGSVYRVLNNIGLFDSVHYISVVSDDGTLKTRLKKAKAESKGCWESAFLKTQFWKRRTTTNPFEHTIDISGLDWDGAAKKIYQLIIDLSEHHKKDDNHFKVDIKEDRKLCIIDDFVGLGDSIYKKLFFKDKEYIILNGQPFCSTVSEPKYYRKVWLEICKNISCQMNTDIAFCVALPLDTISAYANEIFSDIQRLCIVSSGEKILSRYKKTQQNDDEICIPRNELKKKNVYDQYSNTTMLDITGMSDEMVAEKIDIQIKELLDL